MCFLPRRALEVAECEIARAFKVTSAGVEPIAFIVPRRVSIIVGFSFLEADVFYPMQADSFQSDIYPPAPSSEPSLTAAEFFAGKTAPLNLVSLEDGAIFAGNDAPAVASVPPPAPAPLPEPTFTHAVTKSAITIPVRADSHPASTPIVDPPRDNVRPCRLNVGGRSDTHCPQRNAGLEEEVDRLNGDLREARQKIRNLELQVEGLKANARKAAQTLMEG
jgi:coronin-1B/1C/6